MAVDKVKLIICEYCSNSSAHGVQHVCGDNVHIIRRIIWLLFFLVTSSLFISALTFTIQKFFRYESTTSISMRSNTTLDFPALTVCNMNSFRRSKIQQKYPNLEEFLEKLQFKKRGFGSDEEMLDLLDKAVPTLSNISVFEFYETVKHEVEDVFIRCDIGLTSGIECSKYVEQVITDAGICYTFNKGQDGKSMIPPAAKGGVKYGAKLILDLQPDEYISAVGEATGMFLLVHDQKVFPRMTQEAFVISPGKHVLVSVQKVVSEVLSKPYSKESCLDEDQLRQMDELGSIAGFPYSEDGCLYQCEQEALSKSLGK